MCENSSRLIGVPVVVEPVVAVMPLIVVEVEITDVLIANAVAVLYEMPSAPLPSVKLFQDNLLGCILFGDSPIWLSLQHLTPGPSVFWAPRATLYMHARNSAVGG